MLYIDVDAVSKLAHWKVLPLLPEITGLPWSSMSSVSSLKHRAHRAIERLDGKLFRSAEAAATAKNALVQMPEAPEPAPDLLAALAGYPDIDSGEAILLALTAQAEDAFLLTGDKRALRRLAQTPLSGRFAGRILLVEQVLMRCLKNPGRLWLLANVCPHREIDKAISICLGSACDASAANIEMGLGSYIAEINALSDPSFLRAIEAE